MCILVSTVPHKEIPVMGRQWAGPEDFTQKEERMGRGSRKNMICGRRVRERERERLTPQLLASNQVGCDASTDMKPSGEFPVPT